jgi:nucleoid DNA-binding protein
MPKITKKALVAAIVAKTGVKPTEAKRALESVLRALKLVLASGRPIDFGKLGKLKVVNRKQTRRINRNLKNRIPTIENVHKKHPNTVKLLGGKDLSENPQPTIVHKKPQPGKPGATRSFAVALPSWRRRVR